VLQASENNFVLLLTFDIVYDLLISPG